ncbi:MAG: DUF296 domain-containing protein [Candidatus Diapherotrites archaeon]
MALLKIEFSDGEEIIEGIFQAAKEHDIDYGTFDAAEGELKDIELISDDYSENAKFEEPIKIRSISGRVVKQKDGWECNLHVSLNRLSTNRQWISGELKKAYASKEFKIDVGVRDLKKIIDK